jgi:p-aminobenzoyl-glutamate transporter AbgT
MVQTWPNAKTSGLFWADVTTRPIPMMERGAADSMSIAAMLVYILDISGLSTSRTRARIRRRRKQIIEVTMIFKPTLSETHGTASFVVLSIKVYARGSAVQ